MRDDWFSRLTGFHESPCSTTRELLEVNGPVMRTTALRARHVPSLRGRR
jgi:hypothetical protein